MVAATSCMTSQVVVFFSAQQMPCEPIDGIWIWRWENGHGAELCALGKGAWHEIVRAEAKRELRAGDLVRLHLLAAACARDFAGLHLPA